MANEFLAVTYGLAAAASWGISGFSGGFASKKINIYSVLLVASSLGGALLLALALWVGEPWPGWKPVLVCGCGGFISTIGIGLLYKGLALGRMGIVSPIAAVVTAAVPVAYGVMLEGSPPLIRYAGFALAFGAIWLLSASKGTLAATRKEVQMGSYAGFCFGLCFIITDYTTSQSVFWPLMAGRLSGFLMVAVLVIFAGKGAKPSPHQLPILVFTALLDVGGSVFFALAAKTGRLDISSVVGAMYPAFTVGLAWMLLKERLTLRQGVGVTAALSALFFIAV